MIEVLPGAQATKKHENEKGDHRCTAKGDHDLPPPPCPPLSSSAPSLPLSLPPVPAPVAAPPHPSPEESPETKKVTTGIWPKYARFLDLIFGIQPCTCDIENNP